jgi:hypothetical protein
MDDDRMARTTRMTDAELRAFFDRLFPCGFAGADVLAEVAPDGWERSPLVACFHPSLEQRHLEAMTMHRNLERLRAARDQEAYVPSLAPTVEEMRETCEATAVNAQEELTELIGQCVWDVFSDNHDVIAAGGRHVDKARIGSITSPPSTWCVSPVLPMMMSGLRADTRQTPPSRPTG